MIRQNRRSSTSQAVKDNRLQVIAMAAQKAAYKRSGGTVESLGATKAHTFSVSSQHKMAVMPIKG